MLTRPKLAAWLIVAICLRAGVAGAEDAATKVEAKRAAVDFLNERFAEARATYATLWINNPKQPIYLYNLARCNDKLGKIDEALHQFNQYLEIGKNLSPQEQKTVEGYIRDLEVRKAEREKADRERVDREKADKARAEQEKAEQARAEQARAEQQRLEQQRLEQQRLEQQRLDQQRLEQERIAREQSGPPSDNLAGSAAGANYPTPLPVPPPTPPPSAADPGSGLRIAGIAAGGLGAVSVALSVYFGLQAKNAAHDIEGKAIPGTSYNMELKAIDDRGRSDETKEWIFLGAGAGLLIGGGVLYFLGTRSDETGAAPARATVMRFAPALSPRSVGAALQGTF